MGYWLTSKGPLYPSEKPNKVVTMVNQVFVDDDCTIYLIPKNLLTDNYTIPLGINKSKWDVRPSHLHDIGCMYHEVIVVRLPLYKVIDYLEEFREGVWICKDIPIENLEVVKVGFNECNNLLYKGMKGLDIPRYIYRLYRFGVNFNLNWLFTGKKHIDLEKIYKERLYT